MRETWRRRPDSCGTNRHGEEIKRERDREEETERVDREMVHLLKRNIFLKSVFISNYNDASRDKTVAESNDSNDMSHMTFPVTSNIKPA